MKKILAVLIALTLILSTAVFATSAAEVWNGTITIEGTATVPVDGKTFKAYKILNAQAVDANNLDKGVIYTIPAELQAFYNELCGVEDGEGNKVATVNDVTNYIKTADLQDFAMKALDAAKAANIEATESVDGTADNTAEIKGLDFGYYVIEDTGLATPISAMMLKNTAATVKIKADKPFIIKKIDGANDGDTTTTTLTDYNTAMVGEEVPYVLTSRVPEMKGYTNYTFVVTDTLDAGLTYNDDVSITIGGQPYENFDVAEEGQKITITFNDFVNQTQGAEIKIAYTATVNAGAKFGTEGNFNKAYLTYSNNPQSNTTENTVEDVVYTYLVDLIINKTDGNDDPLAGAEFAIKQGDVTLATGTSNADGLVTFNWVDGIKGLKDGEQYTIVETFAPAGYNKADDITFAVTCTDPENGTACAWTTDNAKVGFADPNFVTTIQNLTGSLLPETGGIGTTIFYVVGGLMMVAALVLLISKKRMGGFA